MSAAAQNAPPQRLRGHIPAAVSRLTPLGRENGAERLRLAIGLPLRNEDELTNLLQQIYDPSSPNFHHYLTPEEFTARFGPTEEDYQAVIRYANQNGFTVTATHPNRVVVDVEASVADIERSLHVAMRTYQHPREARTFHAPDTEPTVDLAVPVLHISGLDNYSLPHPKLKPRPSALTTEATPQWGSGPGGAYRGNDFRAAYSVGSSLTGAGQSVGLLQFDGYYPTDIANYESQAGLPSVTVANVPVDGGVGTPGDNSTEVSLDIEMVASMAPGISKIIVYEAPNPSPWVDVLSRMANDNLAKQLSCSWGGGGPDPSSEQIFLQMALQGQTFFNASGDSDAFTGAIDFPSESTNITQVGGTTLTTTGPGGSYVSETVWNWGDDEGSSGGVSTTYSIPPYQQGINMAANLGSTTMRNVPDVAFTADNVYVIYGNGSTGTVGGTSCAAPLWAGFMALVNQQAAMAGHAPLGFINPTLYAIGKSNPNYTTIFHDVTTGNNFNSSSPGQFRAVAGYDLCTGWGTPNGTNMINALAPLVMAPLISAAGTTLVSESCLPTNGAIDSGEIVTVNFALQNAGLVNSTNLVATLLATNGVGLPSGPQNYGTLASRGAAVSRSFSFTALGACGENITPTFQLQDGKTNLGTVTFSLPVGTLGASYSENFDDVTAPALPTGWTTAHGGGQSKWVTTKTTPDSAPNSAFTAGAASAGSNMLVSASIAVPLGPGQLSFRNNYNLEASTVNNTTAYDGGVLEIKIGSGAFTDIEDAGGSFISGGYNRVLSPGRSNPLGTRQVWSGNSGGFITTVIILPAAAAGQTVQFRWICGTDSSLSSSGWYIDSIVMSNTTCCSGGVADIAAGESVSPATVTVSSNATFTVNVTNFGPNAASSVILADTLPAGLTFTSASVSQGTWSNNGNSLTASLGTIASGARASVTIQATAANAGHWTNSATVSSGTTDTNVANNLAAASVTVNPANPSLVLPTIPDFTILEKNALTLTNNASETGRSGMTLTYSLSNAPAGASVGAGSGVFTWTPTEAQGPSTNQITLIVTDNGTPPLSTAQDFNVVVLESNEPPVLAPVANRALHAGMTLTVTNPATDPDIPVNSLTFSLDTAPAGAAINPTTGVFSWTPDSSFVNTSNTVRVVVTDYNPSAVNEQQLSASNSFTVFVAPPPAFSPGTVSNGSFTLTWSSISGQTYRVQYKTNLLGTNWTDLPPDVMANGVTASKTDSIAPDAQRFYRILVP